MSPRTWQRIKDVYTEASELAPEDRHAFVEGASSGQPEVTAEVLRLLRLDAEAERRIEARGVPEGRLTAAADRHTFYPGERLAGRYEVLRFLASGGMGEVYEADPTTQPCPAKRLSNRKTRMMMEDLKTLETKLNALIAKGEMVAATEEFYADICVYQEGNQAPRSGGKKGHVEYLSAFFKTVNAVNGLTLHSQTVGDNVTMSEWTFDLSTSNGPVLWNEVLRRRWENGKVVNERFYTAA